MNMTAADLLVVVPARGGSKRFARKNVLPLAGHSLLARTEMALRAAGIDAPRILSTDDDEIAAEGRALGWLVPFRRPPELAGDDTPTLPVLMHAVDWFAADRARDPSLVMLLQPTSPLRGHEALSRGLDILTAHSDLNAVVAVTSLERTGATVFVFGDNRCLVPLAAGDNRQPLMTPNGAMYLIRTSILRREHTLYPSRTAPLVLDSIASIDIDDEADWRLANAALSAGLEGRCRA